MESTTPNSDRRSSERLPSRHGLIRGTRHASESISHDKITGLLRDISGSGISFLSDADYSVGNTLDLEIALPESQHHLVVQVARIELIGDSKIVGAYFVGMSDEHQKALTDSLFLTA